MVSKDDLVDTVTTAYGAGWRQVKLYFMVGLPTETDEDVLEIAEMAREVIRAGRQVTGTRDVPLHGEHRRLRAQAAHAVPVGRQLDHETTDHRLKLLRDAINSDRSTAKAIGYRYHDGKPGIVEGLLSRGDRRIGAVLEQVWRDGGQVRRLERALLLRPLDDRRREGRRRRRLVHHPRARGAEVLPWDHLDSGLDKEWLWSDWQDALAEQDLDDCRWIPCFDCGVCPQMGTDIQIGPTGKKLLPLSVV
jgi:hypothetical protein